MNFFYILFFYYVIITLNSFIERVLFMADNTVREPIQKRSIEKKKKL